MSRKPRAPGAFSLDEAVIETAPPAELEMEVPNADAETVIPTVPGTRRKRFRWGRLFWVALGGLVALASGLALDRLVADLFARNDWLGWFGLGLAIAAALAAAVIVGREVAGIMLLEKIDALRLRGAAAAEADDGAEARGVARDLVALYRDRPDTATGRAAVAGHLKEIIDGRDLVHLTERDLLAPLDRDARRLVSEAAKRVSVVTAISPRAIVDIVFVLVATLGLIRRLADLYGGRPGLIGFLRLARHVVAHLAVTGGMAMSDSLVQQLVGHGLAARLSARLGEGVVNGLLTARVGLAAIDVCRPLAFAAVPRPGIADVMGGIVRAAEDVDRRG